MNNKKICCLLIGILCITGCIPIDTTVVSSFVPHLSICCGVAAVAEHQPTPNPQPEVCQSCGGQGWLGDGVIKLDCPDCEVDWKQTEPKNASFTIEANEIVKEAETVIKEGLMSKTHETLIPAYQAAAESKKPLIVVVSKEEPTYLKTFSRSDFVIAHLHPGVAIPLPGKKTTPAKNAFRSVGLIPPFIAICPEVLWGETPNYIQLDYKDPRPHQVLGAIK